MKHLLSFTVLVLCCLSCFDAASVDALGNDEILQILKAIQQDVTALKVDFSSMKQDITALKQDINTLKVDSATVKQQTAAIKSDTSQIIENTNDEDDAPGPAPHRPVVLQNNNPGNNNPPNWPAPPRNICFGGNTNVMMVDGTIKKISQLKLGDETLGGTVLSIQASLRSNAVMYRVKASASDNAPFVEVTESHAVLNADGSWSRVHDSTRNKVKLDESEAKVHEVVYNIDTSKHLIWVEGIKFPFADFTEVDADDAEIRMWDAILNQHPPKIDQAAVDAAFVAYARLSE